MEVAYSPALSLLTPVLVDALVPHLSDRSLLRVSQVCRTWRDAIDAEDHQLWRLRWRARFEEPLRWPLECHSFLFEAPIEEVKSERRHTKLRLRVGKDYTYK